MKKRKLQVVVPARNEEARLGETISLLRRIIHPASTITIVDNASQDGTAAVAKMAGADLVIHESLEGKGFAVTSGLMTCEAGEVFVCDADIRGLRAAHIEAALNEFHVSNSPVVRLAIGRPPIDAPVTNLLARPLLRALNCVDLTEPLGGILFMDKDFVLKQHLPGGWGFDVSISLVAISQIGNLPEVPVSGVSHRNKQILDYLDMADQVALAILRAVGIADWNHEDCCYCATRHRDN